MRINHNIASLNTYRQLSSNGINTQKSLEKLSSGLRINKAGDDAAGLAISEKMRSQIRGLDQAARNSQDAISLIQTAEGALSETHSILQRMRELAVQSANDTNTDSDRSEIQKEINQLTSEINRIGNTTEFNTKKLLNGQYDFTTATAGKTTGGTTLASTNAITTSLTSGYVTGESYGSKGVGAPKASASSFTGNVALSDSSTITAGVNNELTLKVDDGTGKKIEHTITLTHGVSKAANIISDINAKFAAANVNAVASLEDNTNKLVITSKTLGSSGTVEVVGGGFADDFMVAYSSNTGQVTNRGNAGDTFRVSLEGSDGTTIQVNLMEDVSTASNTATKFAQGATAAATAANLVESLNKAFAADAKLAGRYMATTTGTGSDKVTIKATAASDGYAISQFSNPVSTGGLAVGAGTASDISYSVVSVTGTDVDDVWIHDDEAASVTGSAALDNTSLGTTNVKTYTNNNELTFSLDGVEKTVNMDAKVYDGKTTRGTVAYQAMRIDAATTAGDTVEVVLGGKTITLTGHAGASTATNFQVGATTVGIKDSLEAAILADSDLAGKYVVSAANDSLVIKAADVNGTVSGLTFTDEGTGNTAKVETAVAATTLSGGTAAKNSFYLTGNAFADGVSTYSIDLKDATDGTIKTITLTAESTAGSTSATLFEIGATAEATAANIATALNLAINAQGLAGQYTAGNVGGVDAGTGEAFINVTAAGTGSKYNVGTATVTGGTGVNVQHVEGITNGVKASNTGMTVTGQSDAGDTFSIALKGIDGVNKTLTLTATAGTNTATTFTDGTDANTTAANIRTALQMAIDADWRMKDRYIVSGTGAQVEITAADEGTSFAVGAITKNGTMTISGPGTQTAGQTGQTSRGLQLDLQAKIDEKFKSSVTDTVTGIASVGDKYSIQLEGYNGEMQTIELTAAGGNSVTTFQTAATTNGTASNIVAALNQAIADNTQLGASRYEAVASGDTITIRAKGSGDGSKIAQSSESQIALGSIFAVTNGAESDEQSLSVSIDSGSHMVLTSNRTDVSSSVQVTGSNLADTLFGAVETRQTLERQVANNMISFEVDGQSKSISLENKTYQDLNDFIATNSAAFAAAGVSASNVDGKLKLTSLTTGQDSNVTDITANDATKQLGLVQEDGSALAAGNFVSGANGNNILRLSVDGETVEATIQEGNYADRKLLAAAVQSAINSATATAADVSVAVDSDNKLVISSGSTGTDSRIEIFSHATNDAAGTLGIKANNSTDGQDQKAAEITFQIGANNGQSLGVRIADMRANNLSISGTVAGAEASVEGAVFTAVKDVTDGTNNTGTEYALDVSTAEKAAAASKILDNAITAVSAERSKLGAYQNRLEHTINNLGTSSENLTAAESRIRDVDMAKEMMEFTKNNILSQAAQAMLAQANQQPQGVLQLLR